MGLRSPWACAYVSHNHTPVHRTPPPLQVIRNEALLLLVALTRSNEEVQKIAAFEGAFDRWARKEREKRKRGVTCAIVRVVSHVTG